MSELIVDLRRYGGALGASAADELERLTAENAALTKQVGRLAYARGRIQAGKDPDLRDAQERKSHV